MVLLLLAGLAVGALAKKKAIEVNMAIPSAGGASVPELVTFTLAVLLIGYLLNKKVNRDNVKANFENLKSYIKTLLTAAQYSIVYCLFAVMLGNLCDLCFPKYNSNAPWYRLLAEVCLQAGANAMLAQFTRDVISVVPLPDMENAGSQLPASSGGVIFAFILFSRQGNWKEKVMQLDKLLEKDFIVCFPKSILRQMGLM